MDEKEALRQRLAQAIYSKRPFRVSASAGVFPGYSVASPFSWDGAPAYYQAECMDFADAVIEVLTTPEDQGWFPVADAPRDGSWFMTYSPEFEVPFDFAAYDVENGGWVKVCCGFSSVTHWRPMPVPPLQSTTLERTA